MLLYVFNMFYSSKLHLYLWPCEHSGIIGMVNFCTHFNTEEEVPRPAML